MELFLEFSRSWWLI